MKSINKIGAKLEKFPFKTAKLCANLVIRRRSRKLGEPRLLGMDGDLEERLPK